jgi:hypothetical protein
MQIELQPEEIDIIISALQTRVVLGDICGLTHAERESSHFLRVKLEKADKLDRTAKQVPGSGLVQP